MCRREKKKNIYKGIGVDRRCSEDSAGSAHYGPGLECCKFLSVSLADLVSQWMTHVVITTTKATLAACCRFNHGRENQKLTIDCTDREANPAHLHTSLDDEEDKVEALDRYHHTQTEH